VASQQGSLGLGLGLGLELGLVKRATLRREARGLRFGVPRLRKGETNALNEARNRPKDARTVSVERQRIFHRNRIQHQCLRERASVK
jgi:hypothetical protein